jgi:glycosyltransferase involved in cell wall biosynthesis
MLHIVADTYIYELQRAGGISRFYSELFSRLCKLEADISIDLISFGKLLQSLPSHPKIHHTPISPLWNSLHLLRPRSRWQPLVARVRQMRLDAVQGSPPSIWHSTYYTEPSSWKGKKAITVYDMIDELFPDPSRQPKMVKSFQETKKQQVSTADAIICISNTTRQDIHDIYNIPLCQINVVPLAYNQQAFYPLPEDTLWSDEDRLAHQALSLKKPYILYVGGRTGYKNFTEFIKAYSVWSARSEVDLVLAGPPWNRTERSLIETASIHDNVHFLTNVNDAVLRHLYNGAQAFVYPSLYEGFGIPLLEAMACKCPIVASRIPSFVEIAEDYPVYFDPYRVDELLVSLDTALNNRRSGQLMKRRESILPKFSWSKTAEAYLNIYRQM